MLDKRFSKEIEKKWIEKWKKEKTYKFDKESAKPFYIIDTPPPFTSGKIHMGHALSFSYIDFTARYKRMKGYEVYYPQGWDTQGFPTEVKVEKKYGKLPRKEFIKKCKEWTEEYINIMNEQLESLGFSHETENQYITYKPEYHEKVQRSIIEMYKKGLIYRANHPVYYCPHCKSALAKTDVEEKEKDGWLYYIKFGEETIATTRPELIEACVAVAANPEDERYKGKEKITTPFGKEVKLILDKDVDKEFGTGLVMICTYGDIQDVIWKYRYGLDEIELIDKEGKIKQGRYKGLTTKEARKKIIEDLEQKGLVVKKVRIKHKVKIHDRCKTDVELINSMQWFAKIKGQEDKIREWAKQIKWYPSFGIHYLTDWLDNIEWDWVISRQRMFGTPIPFYYCEKCNHIEPAKELPFYPEKAEEIVCPKCGNKMTAEKDVFDCWVDSSITPLIVAGWPEQGWEKLYPSDLRPQGVEIVRTWAFYTIYRSGNLTGKIPFKNILLNGNVLGTDGRKMSKSIGNVISPTDLLKQYPADAIRQWAAMSGVMAKDRAFSYEDITYAKNFLTKLWNVARFYERFKGHEKAEPELIDKWILYELNRTIKEVTEAMESFEFQKAIKAIHIFFWNEVADNYLEYIKHRVYGEDENSKNAALETLREIIYTTIKLLSPFAPFITEELYHTLFNAPEGQSIHRSKWPETKNIEEITLDHFKEIISEMRKQKNLNKISLGKEIEKIIVYSDKKLNNYLIEEIKAISKAKEIEVKEADKIKVEIKE